MAEEGAIAKQLRHWRDTAARTASASDLWKQFAELGLTGICIPEEHGGLGLGQVEAAIVLEEIGRNLTPSPFLTTAVVGASAIEGTSARRALVSAASLPARPSLRWQSTKAAATRPSRRVLRAERRGNGFSSTAPSNSSSTALRQT